MIRDKIKEIGDNIDKFRVYDISYSNMHDHYCLILNDCIMLSFFESGGLIKLVSTSISIKTQVIFENYPLKKEEEKFLIQIFKRNKNFFKENFVSESEKLAKRQNYLLNSINLNKEEQNEN